jgi:RNA polymerase sigma-70 factor, ECF subfamily
MNTNDQLEQNRRFLDLISDNQLRIQKLCNAYTWNRDDHEDLYQEILCQLWRALPNLKNESYSKTWLYRVALNTSISFVRKDKKQRDRTVSYDEEQVRRIPANDSTPDSLLQTQLTSLFQAISRLNEMEKAVIALFLEDLSYEQIAEVTGLSEANVGVTLHRAKKKLSELMKEPV